MHHRWTTTVWKVSGSPRRTDSAGDVNERIDLRCNRRVTRTPTNPLAEFTPRPLDIRTFATHATAFNCCVMSLTSQGKEHLAFLKQNIRVCGGTDFLLSGHELAQERLHRLWRAGWVRGENVLLWTQSQKRPSLEGDCDYLVWLLQRFPRLCGFLPHMLHRRGRKFEQCAKARPYGQRCPFLNTLRNDWRKINRLKNKTLLGSCSNHLMRLLTRRSLRLSTQGQTFDRQVALHRTLSHHSCLPWIVCPSRSILWDCRVSEAM